MIKMLINKTAGINTLYQGKCYPIHSVAHDIQGNVTGYAVVDTDSTMIFVNARECEVVEQYMLCDLENENIVIVGNKFNNADLLEEKRYEL